MSTVLAARTRYFGSGLLKLVIALGMLVGGMGAYRFLLHPLIESALHLDPATSSFVRRIALFAIQVLAYWAFIHFVERRRANELTFPWKWILLSGIGGAAAIGVTILTLYATGHYRVVAYHGLSGVGDALGTLWIAAVLEEIVFRAILFRLLAERVGNAWAAAVSALVFGVVHLSNNGAGWVAMITVTLAGVMLAGIFVLSRNLWVTAASHFCWNATIFLFAPVLSGETGFDPNAPFTVAARGAPLWTGGAFGPENSVINIAVSLVVCVLLWRAALARPSG